MAGEGWAWYSERRKCQPAWAQHPLLCDPGGVTCPLWAPVPASLGVLPCCPLLHCPPPWAWCLVLSHHWQTKEQSFPALPVEAGDRRLVMVGVDRETSECSPRVVVGSVLGSGGRVQGQAQLSGVDQGVMDGGCVSSACWLVWGSCTGQALTPRSGWLVGGAGSRPACLRRVGEASPVG